MFKDIYDHATSAIPGFLGAIISLSWIEGSVYKKVSMVICGAIASYYSKHDLASTYNLSEGFVGFVVGVFGMTFVDLVFKTWATLDVGEIINEWVRLKLGLKTNYREKNKDSDEEF